MVICTLIARSINLLKQALKIKLTKINNNYFLSGKGVTLIKDTNSIVLEHFFGDD